MSVMFELTSFGTLLPSWDVETRILNKRLQRASYRFQARTGDLASATGTRPHFADARGAR